MKRHIRFRLPARRDVAVEALFLSASSAVLADRFMDAVDRAAARLVAFPSIGRRVSFPRGSPIGLRSWPVPGFENILVFYRPVEGGIDVVRVIHGARDIRALPDPGEE